MFRKNTKHLILLCILALVCYYLISLDNKEIESNPIQENVIKKKENSTNHKANNSKVSKDSNDLRNHGKLESKVDTWQYIGDKKQRYKIFSAYYEDRKDNFGSTDKNIKSIILVNTILPLNISKVDVHCHFRYRNKEMVILKPTNVFLHPERIWSTYIATFVYCPVMEGDDYPIDVGITYKTKENLTNLVKIRYPENFTRYMNPIDDFAVCPTPLHFYFNRPLRVVEFVEVYRMMGATTFYIYNDTSSANVQKVLKYYEKQGIVQLFNWPTEYEYKQEVDIRVTALFNAFNDCLYRAHVVDNIKYLITVDYDELIMIFNKTKTLRDFMAEHTFEKGKLYHSVLFQNSFLFHKFKHDYSTVPKNAVNKFLHSQVIIERVKQIWGLRYRAKYISIVKSTIMLTNHDVLEGRKGTGCNSIPPEMGLVFHYREGCSDDVCDKPVVPEFSARKFAPKIWEKVDFVCAKIFKDGICPVT